MNLLFFKDRGILKNYVYVLNMLYVNNIILYEDVEFDNEIYKDSNDN